MIALRAEIRRGRGPCRDTPFLRAEGTAASLFEIIDHFGDEIFRKERR